MKNTPKLIMVATMVMIVSMAIVLTLVLVLLAQLYCSLLFRRRRRQLPLTTTTTTAVPSTVSQSSLSPLTSFYAHGVLQPPPPRNFLFPSISQNETNPTSGSSNPIQNSSTNTAITESDKNLVYISNPIYENQEISEIKDDDTPFETPDSSPSRLENEDDDDADDVSTSRDREVGGCVITPPLSPMKKLPAKACSVSLRDVMSLGGVSGSESNSTNNGDLSFSLDSPSTSPSW